MKKVFDGIRGLITLFFVSAIIFGALKEGYVIQVILVVVVIGYFIWLSILKDDREEKRRQDILEKQRRDNFNSEVAVVRRKMYSFGYTNDKISMVTYDLEESGEYLTEYEEYGIKIIDKIIDETIPYPSIILQKHIARIEEEILKLPKVKDKRKYLGFD
jgi:hypothetical protein